MISASESLRACLWPLWLLRFCGAIFVPLSLSASTLLAPDTATTSSPTRNCGVGARYSNLWFLGSNFQGRPKHNHNHNFSRKHLMPHQNGIFFKRVLHLMPHQNSIYDTSDEKSLWFLCVPRCRRGIWCVIRGTPKMKNGAPRDELKNGRGRGWAGP